MVDAKGEPQPWDRQPDEPEEAWVAFRSYRDQTPPRRLSHSAPTSAAKLSRWYGDWRWRDRVLSYDRYLDAIRREQREGILKEAEKDRAARQLGQLKAVQDLIDRELSKLLRDAAATEAFGLVKVSEINKLLNTVVTLERLIQGESTENVASTVQSLDKLTPDELRQLRELKQKINKEGEEEE